MTNQRNYIAEAAAQGAGGHSGAPVTALTRFLVTLALTLLAVGCAPPLGPTEVSPAFSPEHQQAVLDAVEAWHVATDGGYPADVVFTADAPEASYTGPIHVRPGPAEGRNGKARGTLITIDTAVATSPIAVQITTMHEIGHALGLEHTHGTLMAESFNDLPPGLVKERCIDATTLEFVCAHLLRCGLNPTPCKENP